MKHFHTAVQPPHHSSWNLPSSQTETLFPLNTHSPYLVFWGASALSPQLLHHFTLPLALHGPSFLAPLPALLCSVELSSRRWRGACGGGGFLLFCPWYLTYLHYSRKLVETLWPNMLPTFINIPPMPKMDIYSEDVCSILYMSVRSRFIIQILYILIEYFFSTWYISYW